MRRRRRGSDERLLLAALAAAYVAFAATFRGPRTRFWQRMTFTGLSLGGIALASEPRLRRLRFTKDDVALGLASAAGLYVVFRIGDAASRRLMPRGAEQIDEIYELRSLAPKNRIAARLAAIVAPAEELFWRGFVQRRLQDSYGPRAGTALGIVAYGGAHLTTGNATLLGAATVAGAYWGGLAAAGMSVEALIVSHVTWDLFIFLIAPTSPA